MSVTFVISEQRSIYICDRGLWRKRRNVLLVRNVNTKFSVSKKLLRKTSLLIHAVKEKSLRAEFKGRKLLTTSNFPFFQFSLLLDMLEWQISFSSPFFLFFRSVFFSFFYFPFFRSKLWENIHSWIQSKKGEREFLLYLSISQTEIHFSWRREEKKAFGTIDWVFSSSKLAFLCHFKRKTFQRG